MWRGLGIIPDSGMYIKDEFRAMDGGSFGLDQDAELAPACSCPDVIVGRISLTNVQCLVRTVRRQSLMVRVWSLPKAPAVFGIAIRYKEV